MARHERSSAQRREPGRAKQILYLIASVWAWLWSLVTVAVLFALVPEWLGFTPASAQDIEDGIIGAVLVLAMTGTAWLAVYALSMVEVPPPTLTYRMSVPPPHIRVEKQHRLPRPGSAARKPMRQLSEAEVALAELLRRLSDVLGEPVEYAVERAWRVAADTANSLRSVAARIETVEFATKHAPPPKQAALEEAVGGLLRHVNHGLDAYRGLIAAAGLLAANTPVEVTDELVEATESLAGLAAALRELSGPDKDDYRP